MAFSSLGIDEEEVDSVTLDSVRIDGDGRISLLEVSDGNM